MMKKLLLVALVSLAFTASLFAQSAERISDILETENVTLGQLAYLAGTCGNGLDDEATYSSAIKELKIKGLIPESAGENDKATIQSAAGIFAKTTGIKGGLLYRIFKNDRYAFKELKATGAIPQNVDPHSSLSGRDALAILNAILETD